MYAPVQTDKTAPSAQEVLNEARAVVGDKPLTSEEITKVKRGQVRALPGQYESTANVLNALQGIVVYQRPDDYVQTYKRRVEAQKDADIEAAAREIIRPDSLTWVVVGDRKQVEQSVRALKIGEVQVLDTDGKPVK